MGNTTYVIGVHFSKESKDTLEDKMKRLMRDDVKAANFWIENNLWLFRFLSWRNASERYSIDRVREALAARRVQDKGAEHNQFQEVHAL